MRSRISKSLFIAAISCGFATNASAIANGFYMGIMMGPATNNSPTLQAQIDPTQISQSGTPDLPPGCQGLSGAALQTCFQNFGLHTTPADPRSSQFASRIFIGNKFNTYAAIEGGVTFFSSIKYDSHDVPTYGGTDQRVRDLDVVVKGIFPFGNMFDIYGKAGIAVTYITTGGALNPTFDIDPVDPANNAYSGSNTYKSKFSPTYSIGASYDINQSWVADFSYNTVQVGNNIGSVIFYALGISYHFTDKYCGQFLCDD